MLARLIASYRMRPFFAAYEARDVDGFLRLMDPGTVQIFPEGLPFSGAWTGPELRELFAAIFAHNRSLTVVSRRVAVRGSWSPRGRMTVVTDWSVVETGVDGHVVTNDVLSVARLDRWKSVESRDFFSNVPGLAEHYATMPVPARATAASAV